MMNVKVVVAVALVGQVALNAFGATFVSGAGPRNAYFTDFGRYEARTPVLEKAPAAGFHGRVADLERVTAENAVGEESRQISLVAWRGERVHAQVVVWSDAAIEQVRTEVGALTGDGGTIPADAVSGRVVKYVLTIPRQKKENDPPSPELSIGDLLDDVPTVDLPANGFRPFWFTVKVPRDAHAGTYRGVVTVRGAENRTIDFPLEVTVRDRLLPEKPKFFLDLWQNPWAVARYHGVKPFSNLHYELLRPLYEELAAAGQKVITATICDYPWNKDTYFDNYRSMVEYKRKKDGSRTTDFTLLDEYVAFAESCGLGPQIHCYTMVKFGWRPPPERHYYYTDEATGDEKSVFMKPSDPQFEEFWKPFLVQFEEHVKAKGWAGRIYVALDELPPAAAKASCDLIGRYAPSLRFAIASDKPPLGYDEVGVCADNFSQALRIRQGEHLIEPKFLSTIPVRRAAGKTTTFYICNIPEKPNTWVLSPLVESEWMGLYAAAQGFDGMLRWAAIHWPRDPMYDASYGHYEPGEAHLIYPGARASTRWELLKGSIWDFEKIRILRETGAATPTLEAALKEIDFVKMADSSEAEYRAKVGAVKAAIDAASVPPPVPRPGAFDAAVLHGETDKARAIDYAVGEEIVFTISLQGAEEFPAGAYSVRWTRTGDDGVVDGGEVDAKLLPLVVRTKSLKPGFVRVRAELFGPGGRLYVKSFRGDATTPEGRKAMNAFERTDRRVFFDGSAGAEPEKLQSVPEPVDFDEFWTKRKARLAKVPMKAVKSEVESPSDKVKAYAVSIACAGPHPSTGYLTVPVKPGKYPVRVSFHGYGHTYPGKGHVVSPIDGDGKTIWFNFSPHGYELGREPEYYEEFFRSICSGKNTFGFNDDQNRDPENCYFSGFTYRIMRALEWLKTLPEWDGKNLIVGGGSMGGMQSMWAIGLDSDVTEAYPSIPWNCDMGGRETLKRIVEPWYIHETPALRYYDPVNLAKRANPKCRVEITRAGLGDFHCPPSGISVLYNNLPCSKKVNWVQGSTHGYVPNETGSQKFSVSEGW